MSPNDTSLLFSNVFTTLFQAGACFRHQPHPADAIQRTKIVLSASTAFLICEANGVHHTPKMPTQQSYAAVEVADRQLGGVLPVIIRIYAKHSHWQRECQQQARHGRERLGQNNKQPKRVSS